MCIYSDVNTPTPASSLHEHHASFVRLVLVLDLEASPLIGAAQVRSGSSLFNDVRPAYNLSEMSAINCTSQNGGPAANPHPLADSVLLTMNTTSTPRKFLFFTNSEYGQANIVLSVAHELCLRPNVEVHIASFPGNLISFVRSSVSTDDDFGSALTPYQGPAGPSSCDRQFCSDILPSSQGDIPKRGSDTQNRNQHSHPRAQSLWRSPEL